MAEENKWKPDEDDEEEELDEMVERIGTIVIIFPSAHML